MIEQSKSVRILAEFSNKGKPPVPRKFKWIDNNGYEETIIVDQVININADNDKFVEYECYSFFEICKRRYYLTYWNERHKWYISERPSCIGK